MSLKHESRTDCQARLETQRVFLKHSIFIVVLLGVGFAVGQNVERRKPDRNINTGGYQTDLSMAGETNAATMVSRFRREVIRLIQSQGKNTSLLREKELMLLALRRRVINTDSPSVRRLECEIREMKRTISVSSEKLMRIRQQLSKLTAVHAARANVEHGLEKQDEIDARRIILEHEVGLKSHDN